MTTYDEALTLGICLGSVCTGLFAFALWMQRDDLQGPLPSNPDWPETPGKPAPDLLACQCSRCRRVRCVDARWVHEATVTLPAGCRVSHGLCPICERRMHAEINAMAPTVPNVKLA